MVSGPLEVCERVPLGDGEVDLFGSANLWIEDTLADDQSIRLTQAIIQRALEATAPGQLELMVFDDALSGVAAPFWPLNSGGEKVMAVMNDEQEFAAALRYLRNHVQGVKNVVQGLARNLVDFRRQVGYPVESYKLVVVSTDVSLLDDQTQAQLAILLKAGPAAGVSFVVHSMTLGANPLVVSMCEHLALKGGVIMRDGGSPVRGWRAASPQELIGAAVKVATGLAATKADPIHFTDVQPLESTWSCSSADGVTFSLGTYGLQKVDVTLGDELNQRHNILITGAVGQGKSNVISVLIHSLCQRYSPDELQLYLLDFKEGVTLQPLVDGPAGEYLPHARVLGLEADREFALSVLRELFGLYRARMKQFKASGVQSLRQFREAFPGSTMPRVVVVIDEFQMMFADRDRVSDEIAELLVRGARLFRASGIHVVLASQTIGGNLALMGSSGEGLFGQVPIRIALKNSLSESRATLGDRNDAAAHLRARQAIVNLDYGDLAANMKVSVAFADELVLAPLRRDWWARARATHPAPFVFAGEQRQSVGAAISRLAGPPAREPVLLLGSRVDVDARPLSAPFGRSIGRNVALIGSGEAVHQIENMVLSLVAQRPRTSFAILDLAEGDHAWSESRSAFVAAITRAGAEVQVVAGPDVPGYVSDLTFSLTRRQHVDDLVVLGLGLDRCRELTSELQDLVKAGPPVGVHLIGWWMKIDSFREQVGYGGEAYFDIRLALLLDGQSAKQLMGDPLLEWDGPENRMLAWDTAELPAAVRVIPYTVFDPDALDRSGAVG
jgi:hypothetical protein